MKRIPVVAMFDHQYPSGREISLLCTRSGYKIIKSMLDELEIEGAVKFDRWNQK